MKKLIAAFAVAAAIAGASFVSVGEWPHSGGQTNIAVGEWPHKVRSTEPTTY
jgi:hypothetical protein